MQRNINQPEHWQNEEVLTAYVADIRRKVPGYDLMLDLMIESVLGGEWFADSSRHFLFAGGGGGQEAVRIKEKDAATSLTIVDSSKEMLTLAEMQLSKAGCNQNVQYIQSLFEEMPELAQKFDAVFSLLVLHFVQNKKAFLIKAYDQLAENGICFVSMFCSDENHAQQEYMLDLWRNYGLYQNAEPAHLQNFVETFDDYLSTNSATEMEKLFSEVGFKKVYRVSQILNIYCWALYK